jgi:hypothetical protein
VLGPAPPSNEGDGARLLCWGFSVAAGWRQVEDPAPDAGAGTEDERRAALAAAGWYPAGQLGNPSVTAGDVEVYQRTRGDQYLLDVVALDCCGRVLCEGLPSLALFLAQLAPLLALEG